MTLGPDDQDPAPDRSPEDGEENDPAEPMVEDLDGDTEGDGSALCVTFCWTPPTEEGTAS